MGKKRKYGYTAIGVPHIIVRVRISSSICARFTVVSVVVKRMKMSLWSGVRIGLSPDTFESYAYTGKIGPVAAHRQVGILSGARYRPGWNFETKTVERFRE